MSFLTLNTNAYASIEYTHGFQLELKAQLISDLDNLWLKIDELTELNGNLGEIKALYQKAEALGFELQRIQVALELNGFENNL
ncbi:MAG: hypothetical protein RPR97_05025 [Colwellia sp.]|jgi:hypothetical protein